MDYLLAVEDTDHDENKGTGYKTRELGFLLQEKKLAELIMLTRHQLNTDPAIRFTSHNRAACLLLDVYDFPEFLAVSREYILSVSTKGSGTAFCVMPFTKPVETIKAWGRRAKDEILTREEAIRIAAAVPDCILEGLAGDQRGVIGALAAVGLRQWGNDGEVLWVKGLKDMFGLYSPDQLQQECGIMKVLDGEYKEVPPKSLITMNGRTRPTLFCGEMVLFVKRSGTKYLDYFETDYSIRS